MAMDSRNSWANRAATGMRDNGAATSLRTAVAVVTLGLLTLGLLTLGLLTLASAAMAREPARTGTFQIRVVDAKTKEPIAVNLYLRNERGKPVKARNQKAPYWKDHYTFLHTINLELPPGRYTFEMERGPEYKLREGNFEISTGADDSTDVTMERFVDMKKLGWWAGDLHVHRPPDDLPLLMLAQDLHVAPVITWWNESNVWAKAPLPDPILKSFDDDRFYHLLAGEDERGGGALLFFNLTEPLTLPPRTDKEFPPMSQFLEQVGARSDAHVDIEKPFWWDMPIWVAVGGVDSIGLAHNHMQRAGMLDNEAWGKPRDKVFYPSPRGNGLWTQDIYYHLLNCGLRIPPSAGSASGVLDNPVGYNRVYVYCGETLTHEAWWEGLKAGRVVVTNGPLLRPRVNDQLPGHVFQGQLGEVMELSVKLDMSLREKVEYLEVVQNGRVVHEVRLDEYRNRKGVLPPVTFETSGWMLVRAITKNPDTFRFATTGPYYVEFSGRPRISRKSAQFFLDWVNERGAMLKLDDPKQQEAVQAYVERARVFWQEKVAQANAE